MKDSLTHKVKSVPSCLAYSAETGAELSANASVGVTSEGYRQVRRSAATIGLAISMGAAFLLMNQNDAAVAAESVASDSESTIPTLPSLKAADNLSHPQAKDQTSSLSPVNVTPLTVKHEVKKGESLWQLAQEYQLAPEAIAAKNKISPSSNLLIGQTLKIPAQEEKSSKDLVARAAVNNETEEQLNNSLAQLRESRKRLQESLAQLKFEDSEIRLDTEFTKAPPQSFSKEKTQTAQTVQSPLDRPIPLAVSSPDLNSETYRIEKNSDRPIPIALTTSQTSDNTSSEFRLPELPELEGDLPEAESAIPVAERVYRVKPGDTLNKIAQRHGISAAELIRANGIKNPNVIKISQQLTIPSRETASVPVKPQTVSEVQLSTGKVSVPVMTASASSVPLGTHQAESQQIAETATNPNATKLIADIDQLQRDYPKNSRPISISSQPTTPQSNLSGSGSQDIVNPQWQSDRSSNLNRSGIEMQTTNVPRIPAPRSVTSNSQNQTRLVGAAPNDPQQYNNMMRLPVGETVGPELPPLSAPDDYLPNTPMQFTGYIWPAKGVLTSGYGWRWGRMHRGVDIAAPIGTPIVAAAAGEVISAGWNSGGFGNLVKLKHADGSVTLYAHNSRVLVRSGQVVEQGELIAEMGSTGFSTGPHLHFEIHPNGQGAVNPMAFLPKKGS